MAARLAPLLALALLLPGGALATSVGFEMVDLGGGAFEARYELTAFDGDPGSLLSIRFDAEDTVQIGPSLPDLGPEWSTSALQPEPLLPSDGRFEMELLIAAALPLSFVVPFVWQGDDPPGVQVFEVFDAQFNLVESGLTTPLAAPEPALGALGLALAGLLRRRRPAA